jgi:multiple sugar transport system substrate-binding protein
VRALEFLQDLIHVDCVTPPPNLLNTDDMNALFRDGRLSMLFGNHALIPSFANTEGLDWGVAPLPQQETSVNVAGGAGYTISKRSEHKEAAWQLVRFLSGPKAQAILAESGLITPARRSVREDNVFIRQQPYDASVFLTETEEGRPVPNFPGVTEMQRVIDEGLRPVWRGERAPADVLRELAPKVKAVIGLDGS